MNYYEATIKITLTGNRNDYTYVEGIVKGKKNYTQKLESLVVKELGDIQYITLDSWAFNLGTEERKEEITKFDRNEIYNENNY